MAERKLLLADDSITIQKVINLTFADEGISVISVGNGLAAIERLQEVRPDLVLADVHMPGLTGYEVCERVRQTPGFETIPVMLLVGSFEPFDEAEARRVGADDYLTKPFQSIKQLVSKVHSLLNSSSGETNPEPLIETESNQRMEEFKTDFNSPFQKSSNEDSHPASSSNFSFRDAVFDDEMIETNSVGNFADTFKDLDLSDESTEEKSENEWQIIEPENQNNEENYSSRLGEATTAELDIDEITPQFATNRDRVDTENVIDLHPVGQHSESNELSNDLLEVETSDADEQPMAFAAEQDLDLNVGAEQSTDVEPEMNLTEQDTREEKLVSPFADLFDDDDLLGIEDEIRAEIGEQNFQSQQEAQPVNAEAITPEIVAPENENQSQEIATVNNINQSTAVEKPGEYTAINFPPEVIDAIAARVVEKLSDKVIEKIAWEIVPDRFDLIVRKTIPNKDQER